MSMSDPSDGQRLAGPPLKRRGFWWLFLLSAVGSVVFALGGYLAAQYWFSTLPGNPPDLDRLELLQHQMGVFAVAGLASTLLSAVVYARRISRAPDLRRATTALSALGAGLIAGLPLFLFSSILSPAMGILWGGSITLGCSLGLYLVGKVAVHIRGIGYREILRERESRNTPSTSDCVNRCSPRWTSETGFTTISPSIRSRVRTPATDSEVARYFWRGRPGCVSSGGRVDSQDPWFRRSLLLVMRRLSRRIRC